MKRWAFALLVVGLGAAGAADVIASDLPLAVHVDEQTYLLPCVTRPVALAGQTQGTLQRSARWMIATPIPYGPNQTGATSGDDGLGAWPSPPDGRHWLGTDALGRDVGARLVHGARVSLWVALGSVLLAVLIGLVVGSLAGMAGGWVDAGLSRVIELMTAFPVVFFALAVAAAFPSAGPGGLLVVLGVTRWPEIARLVRVDARRLMRADFIAAARALGASSTRIALRHVWPNLLGPVLVAASFQVGSAVLMETGLSFLGLGVSPPTASWGGLLGDAHRQLQYPGAWWLAVFPGAAVCGTVWLVTALAEAVRAGGRQFDAAR